MTKFSTASVQARDDSSDELEIRFNELFKEYTAEENVRLIIDTTDSVPLDLMEAPSTEQQTDAKKKLLLHLTKEASAKLIHFASKHVMKHVAIAVDGEALTMHQIKEQLTSGLLQITRCDDNACEVLNIALKDNIKESL